MAFYCRFDPYEGFYRCRKSIGHELKLAIRRYKGYGAVILEAGETDTLVEFDIFHFNGFAPRCCDRAEDIIEETEEE